VYPGDHAECLRRIERRARGEVDQDMERICAGKLGVEPLARRYGLLAVRYLIGEAVARIEVAVDQ
jgi:hypothetical protein